MGREGLGLFCALCILSSKTGQLMGHQKLSFPPHSWGHPWTQMCGPEPGPLGNNPSEMVIVVVAAPLGRGLEEAVNSSLGLPHRWHPLCHLGIVSVGEAGSQGRSS